MSDLSQPQTSTLDDSPLGGDESANDRYDMSIGAVPDGWVEAQIESPIGTGDCTAMPRSARFATIPTGTESSYIANVTALGAAFITGTLWYMAYIFNIYDGPWIAPVVAAVIALAVTFAGGADRTYRSALCVTFYLLTLLVVLLLITHQQLLEVYGTASGLRNYEQALVRTRLQDPLHLVAYGLGGFLAVQINFLQRSSR